MVTGTVISGVGEGSLYMKKFSSYFKKQFGEDFYPGTLNVQMDQPLELADSIMILPEEKGLYPVKCYSIKINGFAAILVVPQVTEHPNTILEIISPVNLREKLEVNDGDVVEIAV